MGRLGTRMDLAMVNQEQGETLRKYMRRFFDKRATVVDVSDKEVYSKTVYTTVAPSKTSVVTARAPSPTSRT
jgi:hypothetical protein